jgi:hypothetical protein
LEAKRYANSRASSWFIISAKHGLVLPEQVLDPYDLPLASLSSPERKKWAEGVWASLHRQINDKEAEITLLMDDTYADALVSAARPKAWCLVRPFRSRSKEACIGWLSDVLGDTARRSILMEFYAQLKRLGDFLGEIPRLNQLPLQYKVPMRGVYFFFEDGQTRTVERCLCARVVRVGTHAVSANSEATLWSRLKAHKGTTTGVGNHRTSIFRLHVGKAIRESMNRTGSFPTWGVGQISTPQLSAAEAELESRVSAHLARMQLLWVAIPDEPSAGSDRAYIEQNAIALLAGPSGPFDIPTEDWLGWKSPHEAIRSSGLWNVNYVRNTYDTRFMEVFTRYVDSTVGMLPFPNSSIAPKGWHHSHPDPNQMTLFQRQEGHDEDRQ